MFILGIQLTNVDYFPFMASLKDSVWVVKGTLPKDYDGGILYTEIQKKDGKVLMGTHYK